MIYQMAPLEGITTYVFRNAYVRHYDGIDEYVSPFISPHQDKTMNTKERNEVDPENNKGIQLIPQVLTNSSVHFIETAKELEAFGYTRVNLNFGCPSATVTTKKKGAGILQDLDLMNQFLEEIFDASSMKISIKTRIGYEDATQWKEILKIYQQFPIDELIIHPRVRNDFYQNVPNVEAFEYAMEHYKGKIVYNGDLFSKSDIQTIQEKYQGIHGVMVGRGLIAFPGIMQEVQNKDTDVKTLEAFHDDLLHGYQEVLSGDRNVLHRMKELWFYLEKSFAPMEKYSKQIKKAQHCSEYAAIAHQVFKNVELLQGEKRHIQFT